MYSCMWARADGLYTVLLGAGSQSSESGRVDRRRETERENMERENLTREGVCGAVLLAICNKYDVIRSAVYKKGARAAAPFRLFRDINRYRVFRDADGARPQTRDGTADAEQTFDWSFYSRMYHAVTSHPRKAATASAHAREGSHSGSSTSLRRREILEADWTGPRV